ncbi:putative antitoxin of wHTH fold [Halalkaliarchaeum sp. AArc-CO]|uniref:hypothetical protein n=1 Tax=Halalkaliarchaeum sp. AArc-CO TaxID=2866381 RepID=UPI00217E5A28|nr:hypothetical protein [Halalkaliarchaeum sp. AArc-CO]UWG51972.1 putative antitoxin of wHTH fold [Halalkaliarchaeum sp. AArc-CO]
MSSIGNAGFDPWFQRSLRDEIGVSIAELFTARSDDDDHREAFADREREFATARQSGDRRTRSLLADGSKVTERAD